MKIKKISVVLLVLAVIVGVVNHALDANTLSTRWSKTYSSNLRNEIRDTKMTNDGGLINVGITNEYNELQDGYMMKTDVGGNQLWTKQYGGADNDSLEAILPTADGGYLAVGTSKSFDFASESAQQVGWILRVDGDGNEVYSKPYRDTSYANNQTTNYLVLKDVIPASDGGYILVGSSMLNGSRSAIVVKIDENGNEQWHKKYGGNGSYFASATQANDGGYILAGASIYDVNGNLSSTGFTQGFLVKIDVNGNVIWSNLYENGENHIYDIVKTSDGNYIVAGPTYLINEGKNASWSLKVNEQGEAIWKQSYTSALWPTIEGIVATNDGGAIFTGYTMGAIAGYQMVGSEDAWFFKVDANGTMEWEKQMGLAKRNYLTTILEVPNGYVASGLSGSSNPNEAMNGWIVKLSNVFTLSFDLNGGESETINDQAVFEGDVATSVVPPIRTGYDFVGWNTTADGSGETWDIASNTMPSNDVILYAQWKQQNITTAFTLSYDLNGAEGVAPLTQQVNEGTLATAPTAVIREGFDFIGWNTQADGSGMTWDFQLTTMPSNDVTLYAQWKKQDITTAYTLSYDLNGAEGIAPLTQQVNEGTLATAPTAVIREGFDFVGWNNLPDGSGQVWNFSSTLMPNHDVTLYAIWQTSNVSEIYNLQFDVNGADSTVPDIQQVQAGGLASRVNIPIRETYQFNGWNTKADGSGYSWDFAKTTMPSHDVTLYAQWKKNDIVKANTGDTTNIGLWMLVLSGSLLVSVLTIKKRNNR